MELAKQKAKEWLEKWISPEEFDDGFSSKQRYIDSLAALITETRISCTLCGKKEAGWVCAKCARKPPAA
jgi:hypothetical protein